MRILLAATLAVLSVLAFAVWVPDGRTVTYHVTIDSGPEPWMRWAIAGLAALAVAALALRGGAAPFRPLADAGPARPHPLWALTTSRSDRRVAGVCGGIAETLDLPSWAVRCWFLALLLCGGAGLLPYAAMWLCLPRERPAH